MNRNIAAFLIAVSVLPLVCLDVYGQQCPPIPWVDVRNGTPYRSCVSQPYPSAPCALVEEREIIADWGVAPYNDGLYSQFLQGKVGAYDRMTSTCAKVRAYRECGYYKNYAVQKAYGWFSVPAYDGKASSGPVLQCWAGNPYPAPVYYVSSVLCSQGTDRTVEDSFPGTCAQECLGVPPICEQGPAYCDGGTWTCAGPFSPIIISLENERIELTDIEHGVLFDMTGLGTKMPTSWTKASSQDAFLFLDRNFNGEVDNVTELFGNHTAQPSSPTPHGFLALAEFDRPDNGGNGDSRIDAKDGVFADLRLWIDANHNGVSEPFEIQTLPDAGIVALDLGYKESRYVDPYGNEFRYRAKVVDARGSQVARWAFDVFLRALMPLP